MARRITRRQFIALVSLCTLVVLGLVGLLIGVYVTRSESGQAALRKYIETQVGSGMKGKMRLGRMRGNFFTGVTIDSLELRDDEDSLFVATGPIHLEYDPRDLVDRRLHFSRVEVEHPVVVLRQHENWSWNFKRMFASKRSGPKGPEKGFGDYVVIDSTHIRDASFRVTIPWHPDDSLHGARRDSAIRANVGRGDHEIRRTREGYTQTYRWTHAYAAVPHMRIAEPDSAGQLFVVDTVHAVETVPTFKWRNVRATVKLLGDTVWIKAPHWDLPGSTGHAEGRITWGSDLPVRYGMRIWGDSVSLADVAWVYPTLPTTGGGTMILDIRNEPELQRLDYAISQMDVRTTKSRLRGSMTFETGGPVLTVHDVKVQADPVDWDLLRTLNGKPFPADWQGTLTGTVAARGGPLNRFYVDAANMTFHDAHVPGAISHFTGHGELDILFPAFTKFHRFTAETDRLDLRSITRIYPNFPKINGFVNGSAVLDSSWLDVRVSNANLTHTDGPDAPTHATGSGRITYGEKFMAYDLALQAAPLSLTTLARSYPKLPLRGQFSGPIHVRGTAPDLDVTADLTGAAGHLTYAGKVDADSVGGYGARGSGTFEGLSAAALVGLATPPSRLNGRFDVDVTGDSLAALTGPLALKLDRSELDGVSISGATARVRFASGVVQVDTLRVDGVPGTLRAHGTLGLTRSAGADSLVLAVDVDSLGGLRRYLKSSATLNLAGGPVKPDSLRGSLAFRGSVRGWLDSLDMRGALSGRDLVVNTSRARTLSGALAVRSVRGAPTGTVDLHADTVTAAGVRIRRVSLDALLDRGHTRFGVGAATDNGATLRAAGDMTTLGDTSAVRLDTLALAIGDAHWALRQPSHLVRSPAGLVLDTLVLANASGGRITGFARVPALGASRIRIRGEAVSLAEVGRLMQLSSPLDGQLAFEFNAAGPRDTPTMVFDARASGVKYSALSAEAFTVTGDYANDRARLQANLLRGGRSLLDASIDYPVALTLFSARPTGDSLRGRIHADSVDLALVEALSAKVHNATGKMSLDLAVSGAPSQPHIGGVAAIVNGGVEIPDAGVRLASIDGLFRVDAARDSMTIDHLTVHSPASNGSASLTGSVVFRDASNPKLDLRFDSRALRVVDKRSLARLDVSTTGTGLTLSGTMDEATLRGALNVDRGTIYIPELVRKDLEELTLDDFAAFFDTTDVRTRTLMPKAPSRMVEHLQLAGVSVNVGDDVWLKSKEANIKLGGSLVVKRARDDRGASRSILDPFADSARYTLVLSGSLSANRGTYLLDLGPVQRQFQVESGRIDFFGTPDFNPAIDVSAQYRVKQTSRADIIVQARISGRFYPQPTLELSSTDATIAQSDLVFYLATGRPARDLSSNDVSNFQRAADILVPTGSAILNQTLRDQFSFMDIFQIQSGALNEQTAGASPTAGTNTGLSSIFQSTRLGGEKQISDRLFLSFSTGLCFSNGTDDASSSGLQRLSNSIEGKVEYRFPLSGPNRLSLRGGLDPSASSLRCSATNTVRGFVPTPQQWGLSLFRSWSF